MAASTRVPSGENSSDQTIAEAGPSLYSQIIRPDAASHNRISPEDVPDATRVPSGEKATESTESADLKPAGPWSGCINVRSSFPLFASHSITVFSTVESTRLASEDNAALLVCLGCSKVANTGPPSMSVNVSVWKFDLRHSTRLASG